MEQSMSNKERMGAELHEIIQHSQALLEATGGEIDEQVKKARSALAEKLAVAKDRYGEYEGRFVDTMKSAACTTDKFVQDKPYYVIGGSFVAGLLLGWFMARR